MKELGKNTPQPILTYKNKNLIQHKLEQLPSSVSEIIIVVGHLGNQIIDTVGHLHEGKPIKYIWQNELLGTAHSLYMAKDELNGLVDGRQAQEPFLVLMGDDIYSKDDLQSMIGSYELARNERWIALVQPVEERMTVGKCLIDSQGHLQDFIDDPEGKIPENIMYTGACLLTSEIFNTPIVKLTGKEEYGLPQTFVLAAKNKDAPKNILAVNANFWKRITTPEDLA